MDAQQAGDLLNEAQRLTARARADRHWTWLPLVVFGGLSLLASPLYINSATTTTGVWAPMVYWLVAGPIGYTVCARYHRRRRQRTGIGGVPVGPYAATAAAFGGLSLVASLYNTENLYHYDGAFGDSVEVVVLGAFLLGAGLVLRARGGGAGDPSNH